MNLVLFCTCKETMRPLSPYLDTHEPSVKCLTYTLALGKLFGVIPHYRWWCWSQRKLFQFRLLSFSGFYLLILTLSSLAYAVPLVYFLFFEHHQNDQADANKERLFEQVDLPMHTVYKVSVFLQ